MVPTLTTQFMVYYSCKLKTAPHHVWTWSYKYVIGTVINAQRIRFRHIIPAVTIVQAWAAYPSPSSPWTSSDAVQQSVRSSTPYTYRPLWRSATAPKASYQPNLYSPGVIQKNVPRNEGRFCFARPEPWGDPLADPELAPYLVRGVAECSSA